MARFIVSDNFSKSGMPMMPPELSMIGSNVTYASSGGDVGASSRPSNGCTKLTRRMRRYLGAGPACPLASPDAQVLGGVAARLDEERPLCVHVVRLCHIQHRAVVVRCGKLVYRPIGAISVQDTLTSLTADVIQLSAIDQAIDRSIKMSIYGASTSFSASLATSSLRSSKNHV